MTAELQVTPEQLQALLARLAEAEETLHAIRQGEVDGLVVAGPHGDQVFTLKGADHTYRVMIEAMEEGAATLGADGTILFCNRRFTEMLRLPHAQVLGAAMAQFLAPEQQAHFAELVLACRFDGVRNEVVLQAGDGTRVPVSLACSTLPEGEAESLCIVATDLTARYAAEAERERLLHDLRVNHAELEEQNEALRATEEQLTISRDRYLDLYDFAPVGYFTVTADWCIVQANLTGAGLLGTEKHQLLQQSLTRFIARESQDDFHLFRGRFPWSAGGNTLELRLVKADGTTFWAHFDVIVARGMSDNGKQESTVYRLMVSDITRRKQAEAALAASEQSLREVNATLERRVEARTAELAQANAVLRDEIVVRTEAERQISFQAQVLDKVAHAVIATDLAMVIRYWNHAAELLYGWSSAEAVGRNAFELISSQASYEQGQAIMASLRQGESWHGEYLVQDRQGRTFPVETADSPFFAEDGTLSGVIGVSQDISARKQAEEALWESQHQFAALIQNVKSGVALIDASGQFIIVNPMFLRLFGLENTPDYILNINSQDWSAWQVFEEDGTLLHVDNHPVRKAALTGRTVRNQLVGMRLPTGGDLVWMLISAEPILKPDGGIELLICTYHDITERKRAEEALRASERRERAQAEELAVLLEAVPTGVYISHDPDCLHMTGNYAADEILRIPHGDELSLSAPEDTKPVHFQTLKDGRELRLDELPAQRSARGEQIKDFEFTLAFDDGVLRHVLGYGTPLLDEQGAPRGSVAVLVDITERKHAEEALQASLHEKEVLLKEIHHRVKNNMQVISSLVSLQSDTLDDPVSQPLFNDLRDRVRTMALVHEKLYQSESLAEIDFAEYTHSLLKYLWQAHGAATANARLTLDVHPVSLTVETAVPCGLILNELVTNAVKHAFRDRADGELTVALHADPDGKVCLSVRDNGVGLPADWRQSPSLGLQLVQMLAGQIRGTLDVQTDGGAAFVLTFSPPNMS